MIRMIIGRTMIEDVTALRLRGHSIHLIREIIVPDDEESRTLARLMRGEVRVKDVEVVL